MSGEKAHEWVVYHHEHAAPSTYVYDFVWDIAAESEGPFCTDIDGSVFLDFTDHVVAVPLGYNNPKLTDRMAELDLVDPTKVASQNSYVGDGFAFGEERLPGPVALVDRLTDLTGHYGMDTIFLSNSGVEAVENAIKIAYDHADSARYGVTFEGALRGRTSGALSLNCSKSIYCRKFPEISGVLDVPFYDDRTCSPEAYSCGFLLDTGSAVSKFRQKLHPKEGHIDVDGVAYVIVEPVQGEGGYRFPSNALVEEPAAVANDYDLMLVADEIQTGVGRINKLRGSDHYPLEPDTITGTKGLRVDATISSDRMFPDETSQLSSAWGAGDIVSSMQGVFTLEAIEGYDLFDNAVARGRWFIERMHDDASNTVAGVHGRDPLLTVESDTKGRHNAVQEAALKRGFLTLPCGYKVL